METGLPSRLRTEATRKNPMASHQIGSGQLSTGSGTSRPVPVMRQPSLKRASSQRWHGSAPHRVRDFWASIRLPNSHSPRGFHTAPRVRFNDGPRLSEASCSTLQAGRQAPHMLCRATHAFGVAEGFASVDGGQGRTGFFIAAACFGLVPVGAGSMTTCRASSAHSPSTNPTRSQFHPPCAKAAHSYRDLGRQLSVSGVG